VFFLLYNNFIPISLYVTIELVNIGQAYLVASDAELYEESLDCPCNVRSSNLVQELGQVSNIFSDKTGTLTRNEMKFVKFIVDGQMYDVNSEYSASQKGSSALDSAPCIRSDEVLTKLHGDPAGRDGNLFGFFRCLTTCHTVIREKNGTYRAESPDELALIEGVGNFHCGLTERGTTSMRCELFGNVQIYEVLAVNAFNSDRKRMSIIVRETSSNEYFLMCKGADSTMLPLCTLDAHPRKIIDKNLLDLACMGLRTLCIAHKKLDADIAQAWLADYKSAAAALQNRAERLAAVAAEIEQNMTLLGVTAIEDRLQDEVPEVIADLAKAGIILWMLTGDKEETAINIGYSCNLLTPTTKTHFLTRLSTPEDYAAKLKSVYDDIIQNYTPGVGYRHDDGRITEQALVMDGPSFEHFQVNDPEQRSQLLKIGQSCRSVVACRLTPIQKQQVVNVVKKDTVPKAITLSIGDGANDVSMIREADVGVGIYGKEGRQAANNADFAIGQFKFLRRLLLVHGRWNYVRQARVFLYSMHKNMVITLTLFWYR
jgi:phospholipid-translocating P-type ATPase (flippase)